MTDITDIKKLDQLIAGLLILAVVPYTLAVLLNAQSVYTLFLGAFVIPLLYVAHRLLKKRHRLKLEQFVQRGDIKLEDLPDRLIITLLEPISAKTRRAVLHSANAYLSFSRKKLDVHEGWCVDLRAAQEKEIYRRTKRHQIECICTPIYIEAIDRMHVYYQAHPNVHDGRSAFYQRDLRLVNDILDDYYNDIDETVQAQIERAMDRLYLSLDERYQRLCRQHDDNVLVATTVINAEHPEPSIPGQRS